MKENNIDINKLPNKEITKFARKLSATNTAMWNAVCYAESLALDPIFRSCYSEDDHKEFFKRLEKVYTKLKKNDESFADAELNTSYFHEFDFFTGIFEKYLEKE